MNTPKPCDSCLNVYYDALQKDNPLYTVECKLGHHLGNKQCEDYKNYKENRQVDL